MLMKSYFEWLLGVSQDINTYVEIKENKNIVFIEQ